MDLLELSSKLDRIISDVSALKEDMAEFRIDVDTRLQRLEDGQRQFKDGQKQHGILLRRVLDG